MLHFSLPFHNPAADGLQITASFCPLQPTPTAPFVQSSRPSVSKSTPDDSDDNDDESDTNSYCKYLFYSLLYRCSISVYHFIIQLLMVCKSLQVFILCNLLRPLHSFIRFAPPFPNLLLMTMMMMLSPAMVRGKSIKADGRHESSHGTRQIRRSRSLILPLHPHHHHHQHQYHNVWVYESSII